VKERHRQACPKQYFPAEICPRMPAIASTTPINPCPAHAEIPTLLEKRPTEAMCFPPHSASETPSLAKPPRREAQLRQRNHAPTIKSLPRGSLTRTYAGQSQRGLAVISNHAGPQGRRLVEFSECLSDRNLRVIPGAIERGQTDARFRKNDSVGSPPVWYTMITKIFS